VCDTALAQPLQILARIGKTIWMIDPEPLDEAVPHELEHLRVRDIEHLRVLDATPARVSTSKKRRCRRLAGSRSKNVLRRSGSDQNGFSSDVAMWFGTMSRMTPSPADCAVPQSSRSSSSPPSSPDTRVGSTTS
jgi:hypothetical protein